MKYTIDTRVRYSEVGMDEHMTLDAVLKFFQDCAVFQSEDLGCGIEALRAHKMVWFLSSWQICIGEYPKVADRICVSTWPYGFQRMLGERNHTISTADGKCLAWGNSNWVLMDTEKQRPIPVPEELRSRYTLEAPFAMEYAPRKIVVPKDGCEKPPMKITQAYLDSNNHVNNARYVQMAEEYLPEGFSIQQLRAEYKRQALRGDTICPTVARTEKEWVISLNNENAQPYAVIAFQGKTGSE